MRRDGGMLVRSNHLENAFPEHWAAISAARAADPLLEESCSDFERLSDDLRQARTVPGRMSEGLQKDTFETIKALKQEILDRLNSRSGEP